MVYRQRRIVSAHCQQKLGPWKPAPCAPGLPFLQLPKPSRNFKAAHVHAYMRGERGSRLKKVYSVFVGSPCGLSFEE